MRILEEFWYGNINPNEQSFDKQSRFGKVMGLLTKNESQLLERLKAEEKEIFEKYQDWQHEIAQIGEVGKISLNKLTQNDLQQFYARLKKNGRLPHVDLYGTGLSDRMVRSCHTSSCRTALEKAKTEGLIRQNPAVGCKLPPKKAKEMQVLTKEEMQRLLIQAKEDDFFKMALVELSTGMRRSEICALKWDDLNFTTGELHIQRQAYHVKGEIHIFKPKTKPSDRVIILPLAVLNVLKDLQKRTESEWMFPSPVKPDLPFDSQRIYRKMKKVLKRAQCKDVRFHDQRHTFATTALSTEWMSKRCLQSSDIFLLQPRLIFTAISPTPCSYKQPKG